MASSSDDGCASGCGALIVIALAVKLGYMLIVYVVLPVVAAVVGVTAATVAVVVGIAGALGGGHALYNYCRALRREMRLERPWVKTP